MKRCSTYLVTKEMKVKTAMKYNYTPIKIGLKKSLIKKQNNGTFHPFLVTPIWKTVGQFYYKVKKGAYHST